jgi:hypothetical protein
MADEDALSIYTITESDGTERQYQLTAKQAKELGGKLAKQAEPPQNKAATPSNKAKG